MEAAPSGSRAATAFIMWLRAVTQGDLAHLDRVSAAAAAFSQKRREKAADVTGLFADAEKALRENRTDEAVELMIYSWAFGANTGTGTAAKIAPDQAARAVTVIKQQTGFDLSRYGGRVLRLLGVAASP